MRRVVVFDLDDTLFPEWQYVLSGFRAVDQWLLDEERFAGFYDHAKRLFDNGARANIFNQIFPKADATFIQRLVEVYRNHKPTLTLHDDARWAIDYFTARGPLGLISDGFLVAQQNKFEALNIANYFSAVVFSDCYGRECWKPSPVPYQKIMETIPGAPDEFVYVADNPQKDFIAARKLGWATIQIARADGVYRDLQVEPGYRADAVITTLFALETM